jgi:transposase-like protein
MNLYHRGLLGHPLRLIITDGNPGLLAALEVVYPFTPHQRCWFHKMQNVVNKVRKRNRKAVVSGAQRIYEAHSRRTAIAAFWRWAERWRGDATQGGAVHRERPGGVVGPLPRTPCPSGHPAHDKPH